jgi:hypothetical protein
VICHIPPGNPENAHTIVVGAPAVPAHLAHGDTLGACEPEVCECGNGVKEDGEACDGDDLGDACCDTVGFVGGDLRCNSDCTLDTSSCHSCGNGKIDDGEECDGGDVGLRCCDTLGFAGGHLMCSPECRFDTTECLE